MGQTLFGFATPANTDLNNGAPGITTSTRIRANVPGTLTKVWWRCPDTAPAAAQWIVARYVYATDSVGAGLASGTFPSLVGGSWVSASCSIHLDAGDEVIVEEWNSEGRYVSSHPYFNVDRVSGDLTGPAEDPSHFNGRFDVGGAITFPTSGFDASAYYVDVEFVPDGSTVDLTPAVVSLLAAPVNPVPGPVTVTLSPAVLTLPAVPVTGVPGVVTVAVTPALMGLAAVPVTPVPGMVTVSLTPAVVGVYAMPLGLPQTTKPPGRVTITPSTGQLTITPTGSQMTIRTVNP